MVLNLLRLGRALEYSSPTSEWTVALFKVDSEPSPRETILDPDWLQVFPGTLISRKGWGLSRTPVLLSPVV